MGSREESLRKILEGTGAGVTLSEEQRREILAHLEDAVEAKVKKGLAEMDAVAASFEDLGNLSKIARQFPNPSPSLVTPEGWVSRSTVYYQIGASTTLLLFFIFLACFIVPKFEDLFRQVKVEMPGLSLLMLEIAGTLVSYYGFPLLATIAILSFFHFWIARQRNRWIGMIPAALIGVLCLGMVVGLSLPLLNLLQGIGRR